MLLFSPRDAWTHDELAAVALAQCMQVQTGAIVCGCCGRVKLALSRDGGITGKWYPAANVIDRLRRGLRIAG